MQPVILTGNYSFQCSSRLDVITEESSWTFVSAFLDRSLDAMALNNSTILAGSCIHLRASASWEMVGTPA